MTEMRRIGRAGGATWPLTSGNVMEESMRIVPGIVIPVIVALGLAGSILSGAEISVAAGHATTVHENVVAKSVVPRMTYRG
jgi:hypothetical protein